jgi:hypothetical protein
MLSGSPIAAHTRIATPKTAVLVSPAASARRQGALQPEQRRGVGGPDRQDGAVRPRGGDEVSAALEIKPAREARILLRGKRRGTEREAGQYRHEESRERESAKVRNRGRCSS